MYATVMLTIVGALCAAIAVLNLVFTFKTPPPVLEGVLDWFTSARMRKFTNVIAAILPASLGERAHRLGVAAILGLASFGMFGVLITRIA